MVGTEGRCQNKGLVNTTAVLFESWPETLLTSPIANLLFNLIWLLLHHTYGKSTVFGRRRLHGHCNRLPFLGPHCHCYCNFSTFSEFLTLSSIFSLHYTFWHLFCDSQIGYQLSFFIITALLKFDKVTDFAGI